MGDIVLFSVPFLLAFATSLLMAIVIVSTQRLHGHLTLDSHAGVQKLHKVPTPRIGGLALMGGCLAGGVSLPAEMQGLWWMIALSAAPAFAFGLIEDLTKCVGVKARLLATILAGLIFCILTGYQITRVDVPGLDWFLALWLPSLLFTAFAIGGVANAINIIDGVNGLASGTAIILLSGFAVVSWQVGDMEITGICLVSAGALAGFFLMNFPMGKIFLGDAGAYATGFILATISVALPARNPELSPLIGLLALSYPVTETMVSIHRRMKREGTHPGQPDRLHLHSLIYRSRALRLAQLLGVPHWRNAITGLFVMTLPLFSTFAMVLLANDSNATFLGIAVMAVLYIGIYRKVALLKVFDTARVFHRKPQQSN
jgi:UDP-N-acetylmuramyl pentapeptide phosphotransferase/UDP-N-acetylglucosamine-1-phosphate transferase